MINYYFNLLKENEIKYMNYWLMKYNTNHFYNYSNKYNKNLQNYSFNGMIQTLNFNQKTQKELYLLAKQEYFGLLMKFEYPIPTSSEIDTDIGKNIYFIENINSIKEEATEIINLIKTNLFSTINLRNYQVYI